MQSRGCGYRDSQPPSVDSNTLYSAQECLNRGALGRELYFKPCCKQNRSSHHVNHGEGPQGRGSAQGLGQVTLASTWCGWGRWPTPRASRAWDGGVSSSK